MERMELSLPDSQPVNENATEQGKYHVGERVDGVEAGPLRITQVVRGLLEGVLQRSGVIEAKVATHEEKASKG